jgi:hypothetical protein
MKFQSPGKLLMALDADHDVSQEEFVTVLKSVVESSQDIYVIESVIAEELGFNPPPLALMRLLKMWNALSSDMPIQGLEAYQDDLRTHYLDEITAMQETIETLPFLRTVLTPEWFDEVVNEVVTWQATTTFTTTKHGAFISHLQFGAAENSLLHQIEEAFSRISHVARRRRLAEKLRDMPGNLDAYISTVFEILVTSRFPKILDYEPQLTSGRPEARVEVGAQPCLIEARATRDMTQGGGAFDPDEIGWVLTQKAQEKYDGQLSGAREAAVLFFGLNLNVHRLHVQSMLKFISKDPNANVLSAIMFSETFHAQSFELWINPNANFPLSAEAIAELRRLFSAKDFRCE